MIPGRRWPAALGSNSCLVVFVPARKAGDPIDGGISTRLLVSFPVLLGG